MGVRADQHVVADVGRVARATAHQGVFHHHAATSDADVAVFGGDDGPEQDAGVGVDVDVTTQHRRRGDVGLGVNLRRVTSVSEQWHRHSSSSVR